MDRGGSVPNEVVMQEAGNEEIVEEKVAKVEDLRMFPGGITLDKVIKIDDWTSRFEEYNYTEEQKAVVNRCVEKTKEWQAMLKEVKNGWK
jgi:hypothetical protein